MTGRALLFDVGNTRIKWGVLDDGDLGRSGAVTHADLKSKGIDLLTRRLPRSVDTAIACNVAGAEVGARLGRVIGIHIGGDLRFVHSERSGYGIRNGYRRPRALGADRWVAMIGARARFGKAVCVVDAGTAVTIDALDRDGRHLGGQILPGLRLMAATLASDTSDIGTVSGRRSRALAEDPFGNTTRKAVLAGSVNAVCGAVERAVRSMRGEGLRPVLVLTGGDASRILAGLGGAGILCPDLVLEGLAAIVRSNR